MAGIYGIDPFFTYTYEDSSFNIASSCQESFDPQLLMGYLERYHPKFTKIVHGTNYYTGIFSDPQFRGTLFVPKEESIDESLFQNMDVNFCRRFVEYHTMDGYFPKNVLFTSPFQQLQSKIKGQSITSALYQFPQSNNEYSLVLNNQSMVDVFDIRVKNAFLHILSSPLSIPFFA